MPHGTRAALVVLSIAAFVAACSGLRAAEPDRDPAGASGLISTPTSSSTASVSPTETPIATPTAVPTLEPTPVPTEPPPVSEVLPEVMPPAPVAPTAVRGGTTLSVPGDTSIAWGGCASDGECHWYNFYWAPTHEVVMQPGEGADKVQHEYCHAHQHWTISGGAPLTPSNYDLHTWYGTSEGQSFQAAVSGLAWPWSNSAVNGIEDFAWTCAYWYLNPAQLLNVSPVRYNWAAANLP